MPILGQAVPHFKNLVSSAILSQLGFDSVKNCHSGGVINGPDGRDAEHIVRMVIVWIVVSQQALCDSHKPPLYGASVYKKRRVNQIALRR